MDCLGVTPQTEATTGDEFVRELINDEPLQGSQAWDA
jgi:hypothetical protein